MRKLQSQRRRFSVGLGDKRASASYIDAVILRDRDVNVPPSGLGTGWEVDDVPEERTYYCQNYHGDVVVLLTENGGIAQRDYYGEYGDCFGVPAGDVDGDGDVDSGNTDDSGQIQTWINGHVYNIRGEFREVQPPSKLVFTWGGTSTLASGATRPKMDDTVVVLEFFERGTQTVELALRGVDERAADGVRRLAG